MPRAVQLVAVGKVRVAGPPGDLDVGVQVAVGLLRGLQQGGRLRGEADQRFRRGPGHLPGDSLQRLVQVGIHELRAPVLTLAMADGQAQVGEVAGRVELPQCQWQAGRSVPLLPLVQQPAGDRDAVSAEGAEHHRGGWRGDGRPEALLGRGALVAQSWSLLASLIRLAPFTCTLCISRLINLICPTGWHEQPVLGGGVHPARCPPDRRAVRRDGPGPCRADTALPVMLWIGTLPAVPGRRSRAGGAWRAPRAGCHGGSDAGPNLLRNRFSFVRYDARDTASRPVIAHLSARQPGARRGSDGAKVCHRRTLARGGSPSATLPPWRASRSEPLPRH